MKFIIKISVMALLLLQAIPASAQQTYTDRESIQPRSEAEDGPSESLWQSLDRHDLFNRLELAGNIGTTGLGIELATPVTKWAKLRVGVDWMPKFNIGMNFGLDSYLEGHVSNKFDRIQELMHNLSGYEMDKRIDMSSKPTMTTLRVLVDIYPLPRNRHWHVTAGFFYGGKCVGKSINKMHEMPSLLTLNMYNRLYDYMEDPDFIQNVIDEPIYGDIYLDPEIAMTLRDKMLPLGRLGVHIGDFKDGTPYMMEPDKDGTLSAKAIVNRFRPYIGLGYGGALSADGKWQIGVDAGIQMWGGVPKVTTHEGIVLNDLKSLRGKVKDYMDLMKLAPVFPSIACRISYTF